MTIEQFQLLKLSALTPIVTDLTAAAEAAGAAGAAPGAATATAEAGIATTQAGIATTQAGTATTQAAIATTQAGIATTQADIATAQAGIATTQAGLATTANAQAQAASGTHSAVAGQVGTVAAAVGQAYEELVKLTDAQNDNTVNTAALMALAQMLGQVADQINGGQVTLSGGTLADPALRIGAAGIYSAAANTLSVAIAGVERLRVTTSGITVFGTVTTV